MVKLNSCINEVKTFKGIVNNVVKEPVSSSVKKKAILEKMSDEERNYYHSFVEENELEELSLPFLKNNIYLKKVKAKLEYPRKKKLNENGIFLPKSDRLNIAYVDVYFLGLNNRFYTVITTSNKTWVNRIKNLIGSENFIVNDDLDIDNDIFNWLMYLYEERNGNISEKLKIENISGFVGNIADDTNVFSGNSNQTTELTVTKAFISNGGELKKVGTRIRHDEIIDIIFFIDHKSNISIDCVSSIDLILLNGVNTQLGKEVYYMLYIYCYLINELKKRYAVESKEFMNTKKRAFSKKIGLEVIKSIMIENGIELNELK
ncbi:TPA: hypothetical protein ACOE19_000914 [Staphylococcus aureus]